MNTTYLVVKHHLYNFPHDGKHGQAPVLDLRQLERCLLGRILLVEVRGSLPEFRREMRAQKKILDSFGYVF